MKLIETYRHEGKGYNPFLIKEGWQVAQLNYTPEQDPLAIDKMDRHLLTDEVFVLLQGTAVLIGAQLSDGQFQFDCVRMKAGVTYNIPTGMWHNIAMNPGSEVILFERDGTHLGDFEFSPLSEDQIQDLQNLVSSVNQQ